MYFCTHSLLCCYFQPKEVAYATSYYSDFWNKNRPQTNASGGNITPAWERRMNTWTDWCLASREGAEVFASEGEWRHIYLWLSQSHYTRILTAWYTIHPSERWLHLLCTLSFSLSSALLAATQLFLNLWQILRPSNVSWGKVSATFAPSFHHNSLPSFPASLWVLL